MNSNKKSLTLSIVIPAYNEEHHLVSCLESIAAQTVRPSEVIVVDNNSTDKTVAVARRYKFVKVIKEPRQGIVFARDTGFEAASGKLIARLDADTILPSDWIARVHKFYADPAHHDFALTGGGYFYNVRLPRFNGWLQGQLVYRFIRLVLGHYSLWGSNMVIPQHLWDRSKGHACTRNDIHEDVDLGIHLHRLGHKITYDESLRVGVYAKRIWSERELLKPALARWPKTMKAHNQKAWWLPSLSNLVLLKVIVPVGLAADYVVSSLTRR